MGMDGVKYNAGRQLDQVISQDCDAAVDLLRQAHTIENTVVSNMRRFLWQMDEAEDKNKRLIHDHLSNLVGLGDYPSKQTGFTLTTGEGPATITIEVSYSGVPSWFFGWWKSKNITLDVTLHHGLKMREMSKSFSVQDKRGNIMDIATFLKSISGQVYQIARELSEQHPQYADMSDFESELVLKVSEILADPSISAAYIHLEDVGAYRQKYETELKQILDKAKAASEQVSEQAKSLREQVKAEWGEYKEQLKAHVERVKGELDELVVQKKSVIEEEAKKEKEAALKKVLLEVEREKDKVEKKIKAMERQLEKLRTKKGNVTQVTRDLIVKLDRWFPDYDFGRNRKLDEEDVTAQLRAECARKVGKLVAKDPDVYSNNAAVTFEFFVRNVRRSAGEKFNGKDLRAITNEVCWLLSNLQYGDLKWVMDRLGRSYNRRTVEDIHSLAESLIIQKEETDHA